VALRLLNREKIATKISDILNPYYSSAPFFLLVAVGSSNKPSIIILSLAVLVLFFSVLPIWDINRRIKKGIVGDAHISKREDRIKPFLFSLSCAMAGLAALYLIDAPDMVKAVSWTVVLTGAAITAVTAIWKISLHAAGISSIASVLLILYGYLALPAVALVPIVFWARLVLKKHTPAQLAAGSLLAVSVALGVFRSFGLI